MDNKSIYDHYNHLLEQTDDWTYVEFEQKIIYNFDPNFYIKINKYEDGRNEICPYVDEACPWLINANGSYMIDEWDYVTFMYGEHIVYTIDNLLYYAGGRGLIPEPGLGPLYKTGEKDVAYHYLVEKSFDCRFMDLFARAWNKDFPNNKFKSNYYANKIALKNIVLFEDEQEKEEFESLFSTGLSLRELESRLDINLCPSDEEITSFQEKYPDFDKTALMENNISKAVNEELRIQRESKKTQLKEQEWF